MEVRAWRPPYNSSLARVRSRCSWTAAAPPVIAALVNGRVMQFLDREGNSCHRDNLLVVVESTLDRDGHAVIAANVFSLLEFSLACGKQRRRSGPKRLNSGEVPARCYSHVLSTCERILHICRGVEVSPRMQSMEELGALSPRRMGVQEFLRGTQVNVAGVEVLRRSNWHRER